MDRAQASVTLSLALDTNGNPAIVWFAGDLTKDYNTWAQFWKPLGGAGPVKVLDSQNEQSDEVAAKLVFAGLNPRMLVEISRPDSVESGRTVRSVKSDDGGTTWAAPVQLPPDGNRGTDYPFDLAVDSQGRAAAPVGSNGGSDAGVCGFPKFSRSNDFATWQTCDVANNLQATQNYSVFPGAVQVILGGNDRLNFLWVGPGWNRSLSGTAGERDGWSDDLERGEQRDESGRHRGGLVGDDLRREPGRCFAVVGGRRFH